MLKNVMHIVFKTHNVFVRAADGCLKSVFKTDQSNTFTS